VSAGQVAAFFWFPLPSGVCYLKSAREVPIAAFKKHASMAQWLEHRSRTFDKQANRGSRVRISLEAAIFITVMPLLVNFVSTPFSKSVDFK
jgi:hypothetical protein